LSEPFLKYAKVATQAFEPLRKHPTDAGVDVFALEDTEVPAFSAKAVRTGLTFEIPEGRMLSARPKSRSDDLVGAGVIDTGYQGEIMIKIVNYRPELRKITRGEALAQLVLVHIDTLPLQQIPLESLHTNPTERGASGGIHL